MRLEALAAQVEGSRPRGLDRGPNRGKLAGADLVEVRAMVLKMNDLSGMVTRTEGVCDGRPCIAGTRITISRIASFYHQGMSAEDIVSEHPHLTPAQVHAALAYYFANRDEIDRDLAAEREAFNALRQAHTITPAA